VSFIDRGYPDIVRDVLTNLTQGVTREVHRVDYDPGARPLVVPDITLERRPVRRASFVQGLIAAADPGAPPIPYVFTPNDYDLVGDEVDSTDRHTIRFRPFGRKPAPGTDLTINYYPRTTDPAPVNDLNVGSVVRTVLEAVSRELALVYAQLNAVYDSAFLDTATGDSLERVVALLGYRRFRAGRPAGSVIFRRRAGSTGSITIPAGTPITDAADTIRYETVETRTLLAGESVADVRVRGAAESTAPVEAGQLTVIQRAIAGIDSVANERPTSRVNEEETDEELRARTRAALLAANKGTLESIRFGLLQLPEVRDVSLEEFPNGVPGELRVSVVLAEGGPGGTLPASVLERIEELRPAGIRVLSGPAASIDLAARVRLTLAGAQLPAAEIEQVREGVRRALIEQIGRAGVGARVRNRPLTSALLADARIVDAAVSLGVAGDAPGSPGADFEPPANTAMLLQRENIAFETEEFAEPLTAGGQPIPVEVRAHFGIQLVGGTTLADAKAGIETKLKALLAGLTATSVISAEAVLQAVRNDAQYGVDPLKMIVTLTSGDQFVQVAQGGASFTVLPNQTFTLVSTEVVL
jgi:hypothetical protein